MKIKLIYLLITSILFINSCQEDNDTSSETEWRCGTHNGKDLWIGPKGGCYYYNSNGNKTYVDRSECNC